MDRIQSMPAAYPTNCRSTVHGKGGDGDPLDVLFFSRELILPGALIKVRLIVVMNIIVGGDIDRKIVTVPTTKFDPDYDNVKSVDNPRSCCGYGCPLVFDWSPTVGG